MNYFSSEKIDDDCFPQQCSPAFDIELVVHHDLTFGHMNTESRIEIIRNDDQPKRSSSETATNNIDTRRANKNKRKFSRSVTLRFFPFYLVREVRSSLFGRWTSLQTKK